jgi:hypothetical protein
MCFGVTPKFGSLTLLWKGRRKWLQRCILWLRASLLASSLQLFISLIILFDFPIPILTCSPRPWLIPTHGKGQATFCLFLIGLCLESNCQLTLNWWVSTFLHSSDSVTVRYFNLQTRISVLASWFTWSKNLSVVRQCDDLIMWWPYSYSFLVFWSRQEIADHGFSTETKPRGRLRKKLKHPTVQHYPNPGKLFSALGLWIAIEHHMIRYPLQTDISHAWVTRAANCSCVGDW